MKTKDFDIVTLKNGITSIRDLASGEILHPGIGPMEEARVLHVEQQSLRERAQEGGRLVVWDVGLGGAANAIAALEALDDPKAEVELHSFDIIRAPTEFALQEAEALGYVLPWRAAMETLLDKGEVLIHPRLRWHYHLGDFQATMRTASKADAVFYDPYSSVSNQELWTLDHLTALRSRLNERATITNYSASSSVRVTWLLAGYYVGSGVGVGRKTETLFASPTAGVVPRPLDQGWLKKMPRSQSSAPIREATHQPATISSADFERLSHHPQFHA